MVGDYCAAYAARLKGVAIVPMRAPTQAAEEIRRVARACASIFPRIWKASCSIIPLSIRFGRPASRPICRPAFTDRPPPYGLGTFEMGNNLFIQHSATNPFEVMRGITSVITTGRSEFSAEVQRKILSTTRLACTRGSARSALSIARNSGLGGREGGSGPECAQHEVALNSRCESLESRALSLQS